ncbi:MAG: oxidoreductase [Pseudomonadota bacterium]
MTLQRDHLFQALELPCGTVLKNRIAKSAMSDALGDGRGNPTQAQIRLYERWAGGGAGLSIVGEVQGNPSYAEKPGNLVLRSDSDAAAFADLAKKGSVNDAKLWLQLGHAGAMVYPPIGTPKGPSAIDIPGLRCDALSLEEVSALPDAFARTADLARQLGFSGVEIHAAHGFLLSQFLSPLFNRRADRYGGTVTNRMRLLLEVVERVRNKVGPLFPVGIKLNATDQLEGGFAEKDALAVIAALDRTETDLIDISGGTYFPGARSASDARSKGPYFLEFAGQARRLTDKPLMVTGGFKTFQEAEDAVARHGADVIGLARALALNPDLPNEWQAGVTDPMIFPRFTAPPEGGITAWYTMRLKDLSDDRALPDETDASIALKDYEARDEARVALWNARFNE